MTKKELAKWAKKINVLTHYGNGKLACVKCGYQDIRALSIDHINGDGKEHREQVGGGGFTMYAWLLRNNYPDGYQTYCMNCQFVKKHKEDLPRREMLKAKSLSKRVTKWLELTNQRFNLYSIRVGLALTPKERGNLRAIICRKKKKGELVAQGDGYYKKAVETVSVFSSTKNTE